MDTSLPKPCKRCAYLPEQLAPAQPEDALDAVGLSGAVTSKFACCAVHYVQHIRWKYDLDF